MESERTPRPLEAIEPRLRALILEGQNLWRQPPSVENAVACATCHFDGAEIWEWAASFPKVKPMPPPFTRVMTLHQVASEALAKHYRLPPGQENRRMARAISAYITWVGEGRPITPGVALGQPRFPARLEALRDSVTRGQGLFGRKCTECHADATGPADALPTFPRLARDGATVVTLEEYLETHAGIPWDSPEATDVAAYLAARAKGGLVQPGGPAGHPKPQGG